MMDNTEQKSRRLFVGIRVPEAFALSLAGFAAQNAARAPGMRWTGASNLHVTLKFLGPVQPTSLQPLQGSLAQTGGSSFELSVGEGDFFERAGALVLGLETTEPLARLQQQIEAATEPLGYAREQRAYRPHITLARRRGHMRAGANERQAHRALLERLDRYCDDLPARSFAVAGFTLYESAGGRYRSLAEYALSDPPRARERASYSGGV